MKRADPCRNGASGERGAAFAVVLMVLVILAAVIMGLNMDVRMDTGISRNLRLKNDALNWSDSGMSMAEEMIAYSIDSRGDDANNSFSQSLGGSNFTVSNPGDSLFNSTAGASRVVTLGIDGASIATVNATFMGTMFEDGSSIIIAAGYEGVGKGAGAGASIALFYELLAEGNSTQGDGLSKTAEVYRHIGGG